MLSSGGPSCEFQLARMEENHERKRRASIPRHRRLPREFRGGSPAKAGSQPMLGLGIIAVDPALGRDLGDFLRNKFGLVFLTFGLTGRRSAGLKAGFTRSDAALADSRPIRDCRGGLRQARRPRRPTAWLGVTPASVRASPIREGVVKDCAPRNPDVVVGNSVNPIGTTIKTARSRMRGVPATTTRRWVPVRAVAVSHLRHGRHWTRNCPSHVGSERSRMRRYRSRQCQSPGQRQSESAQFRSPLPRLGLCCRGNNSTGWHSSAEAVEPTGVWPASLIWGAATETPIAQTIALPGPLPIR